jgi:hypothetical protein
MYKPPQTHIVADIQIREPVGENLNQTHNLRTQNPGYPLQTLPSLRNAGKAPFIYSFF